MLIVIVIIGILVAALVPRFAGSQSQARDTARQSNLSQISTALALYANDYGTFPNSVG
jgi:type II secretory pathway pseudopilin PulG